MIYILQIAFIFILLLRWKKGNGCYKLLVIFQLASFAFAPLVVNEVMFETPLTFFNTIFCLVNLYLIIVPWRKTKFETVEIGEVGFFNYYKKILYLVLAYTIINNLIVLFIVNYYIGDIAVFKAKQGFKELYDSVPYFGLLFRYTSVSRYLGLLALPICVYYLKKQCFKQAAKAFLMSSSTLIAAFAFYSRAQILSFIFLSACLYFYVEHIFDDKISNTVRNGLKYLTLAVVVIFTAITVSRFASPRMAYYADRIPEASYIKSLTLYTVFDYASKGFPNGVMQLELHDDKDVLEGEPLYYDLMMAFSYFHLTSWTKEEYKQRLDNAYNKMGLNTGNDSGTFHGYTCRMVKMMGYICTFLVDLLYYRYVRRKSLDKKMNIKSLTILVFLLLVSINSIFYSAFAVALYPLLFYLMISMYYIVIHHRIVIRRNWRISL